jgi:hypothetical protein
MLTFFIRTLNISKTKQLLLELVSSPGGAQRSLPVVLLVADVLACCVPADDMDACMTPPLADFVSDVVANNVGVILCCPYVILFCPYVTVLRGSLAISFVYFLRRSPKSKSPCC